MKYFEIFINSVIRLGCYDYIGKLSINLKYKCYRISVANIISIRHK